MRNPFIICLIALVLVLGSALNGSAQIYEAVGTRAQGMGGAFVAVADDATASWWNPAGLATGRLFSLVFDRSMTEDPRTPSAAGPARRDTATGFSVAFPAMALSYYRLRVSEIAPVSSTGTVEPDRQDDGTGDVRLNTRAVSQYGLTLGQSLGDHLVVASTLKLVRAGSVATAATGDGLLDRAAELDVERDTKADIDVGAMAAIGPVRVGVSVKHLKTPEFGEGDTLFVMKRQARAGLALAVPPRDGFDSMTVAFDMDLTKTPTVNGDVRHAASGIEVWFPQRRLGVRSGVSVNTIGSMNPTGSAGISLRGPSGFYVDAALLFGSDRSRRGLNVALSMTF